MKKSEVYPLIIESEVLQISNGIVKETNGVKEIILPAMSSVTQLSEETEVSMPANKVLCGTVGFKTEDKIFLNTRKGIVQITNKLEGVSVLKGLSYQFFFIEENKYKGKYTTKHSFVRIVDNDLSLNNSDFVAKNIKEKEVDSFHYIEGSLLECAYLKNESAYNDEKTLWGIFKLLTNGEQIMDVTMVHEAFNFFDIDFESVEKGDYQRLKSLID